MSSELRHSRRARLFVLVLVAACVVLTPWIVYLALTLRHHYNAARWDTAWSGFDVALLVGLAATAWGLWRRSPAAVTAGLVTGTLLCCDAWFDTMFAQLGPDRRLSYLMAYVVEAPLAIALFLAPRRLLRRLQPVRAADQTVDRPPPAGAESAARLAGPDPGLG